MSQADPTPIPLPTPTPTPEPTVTPEPTSTPTATATPSPAPTATVTSTPTPQVGDTRLNPDTDEQQVFNETGEWVKLIPEWNIATMGVLPGLTEHNASVAISEDGGAELTFTVVDSSSDLNGKEYSFVIPPHDSELLTEYGDLVLGTLAIGDLTADKPKRMHRQWPMVAMENDGEQIAYFDWAEGKWVPRYMNVLTDLGSQEVPEWMPQNLGLVQEEEASFFGLYTPGIKEQDFTFEDITVTSYGIAIIVQPHRVFEEHVYDGGTIVRTETWAEMAYDEDGRSHLFLVDSSNHDLDIAHRELLLGINALTENGFVNEFVNWNDILRVDRDELFTFLEGSPRARIRFWVTPKIPGLFGTSSPELVQAAKILSETGQWQKDHIRITRMDNQFYYLN